MLPAPPEYTLPSTSTLFLLVLPEWSLLTSTHIISSAHLRFHWSPSYDQFLVSSFHYTHTVSLSNTFTSSQSLTFRNSPNCSFSFLDGDPSFHVSFSHLSSCFTFIWFLIHLETDGFVFCDFCRSCRRVYKMSLLFRNCCQCSSPSRQIFNKLLFAGSSGIDAFFLMP